MTKKLSPLIAAVAVVAFAVPAVANAGNLTERAGVPVWFGGIVTGTSTNAITETSLGSLSCKK